MKPLAAVGILLLLPGQAQNSAPNACAQILMSGIPPAIAHAPQPLKYRLTTEYTVLGPQGAEAGTHVITGDFTSNGSDVRWSTVSVGQSAGHGQPVTSAEHQTYMEGFHYSREAQKLTEPEFFRQFPATATEEKNLVWDELMFHSFAANLARLRLNEPVLAKSGDVMLAGSGKFTNRRIELTWTGIGQRNREDCVLIHYEALLNHFNLNAGAMTVSGRSDYFGDIWVSISTHEIEYGTLLEEVAGTLTNATGSPATQPIHVLRVGSLQHLQ
jgi:hypothetical protein